MRRKVGLFLVFGAVLPLAAASAAWACGVLATLKLDTKVASPGQQITATGKNYSPSPAASGVTLTLKTRSGQVLSTASAVGTGTINQPFTLPQNLSPGWYVVIASQTLNGVPKTGTPGRTSLRVQGASSRNGVVPAAPWGSSTPSGPTAASAPVAVDGAGGQSTWIMLLAALGSVAMLGVGWTLVGRKTRALPQSQLGV
jgi:hypothetical protein